MASIPCSRRSPTVHVLVERTPRGFRLVFALLAAAILLAMSPEARAQTHYPIGIELVTQLPPFEGEGELDDFEVDGNRVGFGDDDEDLEENIGIAGYYLFELSPGLGLGPRAMLIGAEGDDSNEDYTTFDGSAMIRYTFDTPSVLPFIQGGLGLTYMEFDVDDGLDGIGWHMSLGGGCGFPVGDSVAIYAGLLYHRQAAHLEGDIDFGGPDADVEADVTLSRVLTMVGVGF